MPLMLEDAGYFVGWTGKGWNPGSWDYLGLARYPIGQEFNRVKDTMKIAVGIASIDYSANFDAFLEARPEGQPFFFWLGTREPHRKYQEGVGASEAGLSTENVRVPAYWPDIELVRNDILDYYYEILWLDTHIQSVLASLEKSGELDNTIIVYSSDNGSYRKERNGSLRADKGSNFEGGIRVPGIFYWPGTIKIGHVEHEPAGHGVVGQVGGVKALPVVTHRQDQVLGLEAGDDLGRGGILPRVGGEGHERSFARRSGDGPIFLRDQCVAAHQHRVHALIAHLAHDESGFGVIAADIGNVDLGRIRIGDGTRIGRRMRCGHLRLKFGSVHHVMRHQRGTCREYRDPNIPKKSVSEKENTACSRISQTIQGRSQR